MTWFDRLTGFAESSPERVRQRLALDGPYLVSRVTGRRVRWGELTTPSLGALRAAVGDAAAGPPASVREVVGDAKALHRDARSAGALFQAASQFNLLEMASPDVTPERGVGIYERDHTQGPACAVACGGGTIYRNYFAPVPLPGGGTQRGQTAAHQLDCLADLGAALGHLRHGAGPLWEMRNGYALATREGLERANARLADADEAERDALRALLRVGVQRDVEVLGDDPHAQGHLVTQVYGAAMPVAYGHPPAPLWEPLARLVLEASYEATLLVARRHRIDTVFLTLLGGGVFGNDEAWIADALLRALRRVRGGRPDAPLDVCIVSYGAPKPVVAHIVRAHEAWRARHA